MMQKALEEDLGSKIKESWGWEGPHGSSYLTPAGRAVPDQGRVAREVRLDHWSWRCVNNGFLVQ